MPTEPSWWYDARPRLVTSVLRPAGAIYGYAVRQRIAWATPYVPRLPVICIGNFTVGGTGKTPLTRALTAHLIEAGARPAILSRGYGGTVRAPQWVDVDKDRSADVGDEPLLLAKDAPVLVARDRVAGARLIETDPRSFTHILMDDGLQNPALKKTLTIAVLDGARGVGNGWVMPAGPLRAPLRYQQQLVDVVVVNQGSAGHDAAMTDAARAAVDGFEGPVFSAHVEADGPAVRALAGRPLLAFAGIGVPDKFFAMLRTLGLDVQTERAFPDHHAFTTEDAADLRSASSEAGLTLVTTEKDGVRLKAQTGPLADLAAATAVVPIRMELAVPDVQLLLALVQDRTGAVHNR